VTSPVHGGRQVVVTGGLDALAMVATAPARNGIVPGRLRVDQASLEDAFVALTPGRRDR
jgi:ABC-2 type transport system ATP-binding protein